MNAYDPFRAAAGDSPQMLTNPLLPPELQPQIRILPKRPRLQTPRQRIVEALIPQRVPIFDLPSPEKQPAQGDYSPLQGAAEMVEARNKARERGYALENQEALRLGITPGVAPAFDDAGNLMPRAAGMAQPSGFDLLRNWASGLFGG